MGLAIFGCTLALTFSVWASKPYEVLLATYAVLAVWMLALPVWDFLGHCWRCPTSPDWAIPFNPFYLAFAPYVQPGKVGVLGFLAFFAAILTLSAGLAGLAIGKMRTVIIGQAGHSAVQRPARMRWFGIGPAPSLEGNPVLWYETRRKQPSSWVRTLIRGYFVVAVVFSLFAIDTSMRLRSVNAPYLSAYVVAFEVAIGLPLVLISSATAVVEERARGSLDLLLATPLSTRQIVLAKWWAPSKTYHGFFCCRCWSRLRQHGRAVPGSYLSAWSFSLYLPQPSGRASACALDVGPEAGTRGFAGRGHLCPGQPGLANPRPYPVP